jgi:hypothetical protein
VIGDGRNGVLSDFWDSDALAERVLHHLAKPASGRKLREAARATVEKRYRLKDSLMRQVDILRRAMAIESSSVRLG